ncbi:MAG: flippase-like domain-containing protein [candidate division KSB1 bacterium]|nr:flippase-like domain-containing protein [candidate division KSB1 bacterium]
MSARLKLAAKVVLSGLILWILATRIDWPKLTAVLGSVRRAVLAGAFLVLFVQQFLMVLTWLLVIRHAAGPMRLRAVLYAHLVGNFYGTLLPSSLGIDVVRALYLKRFGTPVTEAAATLVTTRAIGFGALFFLAGCAYFFPSSREMLYRFGPALVLCFGVFLCCLAAVAWPRVLLPLERALQRTRASRLAQTVAGIRQAFAASFRGGQSILLVFALSIVYQCLGVIIVYLLGLSVGAIASPAVYLFVVPAVTILTAIPIAFAGLGVREASFVALLGQVGVPAEVAFSVSLLFFVQALFLAALGGLVHWASALDQHAADSSA